MLGVLLGVGAEGEIGEGHSVRLAAPALAAPRLLEVVDALLECVRGGSALCPAVAVLGRAIEGCLDVAADEQARAVALGPGADLRLELTLAVPDGADLWKGRVDPVAAGGHVDAADLVVVLAGAEGDAEDGAAAAGEGIEGEDLLGQQGGILTQRPENDVRCEADALGDRRGRGEGDDGLVARVDDAVDRAEGAEAGFLGGPSPVGELLTGGACNRVGKSDAELHSGPFVGLQWGRAW